MRNEFNGFWAAMILLMILIVWALAVQVTRLENKTNKISEDIILWRGEKFKASPEVRP